MDKKTIYLAEFKRKFILFFLIICLVAVACCTLAFKGYSIIEDSQKAIDLRNIFIAILIVMSFITTLLKRNQKKKLRSIRPIAEKLSFYKQIYISRLWLNLFFTLLTSFLLVLTGRYIFLYLTLFEVLVTLLSYPFQLSFKKDLEREDLIIVS